MDELEQLRKENAQLKQIAEISNGAEPTGIWPANYPKYRVIRKGPNRGEIVQDAFVLLPKKHERDRLAMIHYAKLCREDGEMGLAGSIEIEYKNEIEDNLSE